MTLSLPYPPTVNHYWERTRHGGVRISSDGVAFRARVALATRLDGFTGFGGARLKAVVDVHPPDARRRDIDNVLKALLDSLQHAGAYDDDGQIDDLHVRRRDKVDGGMVVVRLEAMT